MTCIGAVIEGISEASDSKPISQNQIAATIATLLGVSFEPSEGKAIDIKSKL